MTFDDDIFIIDCWTDTQSKENDLIGLIKILREFNIPILLTGHYAVKPEIQSMVDYYLFDRENPLLLESEFESHGVNSSRWTNMGNWKTENKNEFHHDYAIWTTMRNSFNFAKLLGKKHIHFLEYDNLPDPIQYRQAFLEYSRNHDAVLYEYDNGSITNSDYCATFIFSIKTDIAIQVIDKVKSKWDYFTNRPKGWQLERVFLQHLKEVTNSIHVTKYIANDNELNTQAVWNRDGVNRNGARFQIYLAVDDKDNLHVHLISGFHEKPANKDYLIEINYSDHKSFNNLKIGEYSLIKIGKYVMGELVKVYHQGVEVFNELLKDEVEEYRRKNRLDIKKEESKTIVNVNFVDGPFVEILNSDDNIYEVQFVDSRSQRVMYSTNLKSNHWAKCSIKYYVDWVIKIKGVDNDYQHEIVFNPEGQRFFISFETKSLGDSIAFIPYVEKFRKDKNCKVICATFQNELFKEQYSEIEFVEPGSTVNNLYGLYRMGMFYNNERQVNYEYHRTDPKKEPLMKMGSDILGLDYVEVKPKFPKLGKEKRKQVCIAVHSTAQAKYWNNPTGWQDVTNFLNENGYEVILLSREEDGYMGNVNPKGVTQHPKGSLNDVIKTLQESELFIGISSGLSWLSWASGTPTVIVSGFTDIDLEPFNGITRIINKEVCNSCWSNYDFDAGDWNWCPVQKGTDRQFECSKEITSNVVIEEIKKLIL